MPSGVSCDLGLICPAHAFSREHGFHNAAVFRIGVSWPPSLRSPSALTG